MGCPPPPEGWVGREVLGCHIPAGGCHDGMAPRLGLTAAPLSLPGGHWTSLICPVGNVALRPPS